MRVRRLVALVAVLVVAGSGCQLLSSANRHAAAPAQAIKPWWCRSGSATPLTASACQGFSAQLDLAVIAARARPHASDALAAGASSSPYVAGEGAAFRFSGPTAAFAPNQPDTLLYDGVAPTAQLAAIEWNVTSASAPAGFSGDHDEWTDLGDGTWRLRAWIIRPFENQTDLFASTHPCLGASSATYAIADSCYTSTHPEPLRVLVTNDDGYSAAGIDAVVEALIDIPALDVTVSAPAINQSGTGDNTTPGGVTATDGETASGYPATVVNGFPGDAVLYALNVLRENPDLVVSGSNLGQNIVTPIVNISGTVGAARIAARNGISAVAISQEGGTPPDFPESALAITAWVTDYLLGRVGPPTHVVANINVPTCTSGTIRGTATLPQATAFGSRPIGPTNCTSTVTTFADDLDAFLNGFVSISNAGTG